MNEITFLERLELKAQNTDEDKLTDLVRETSISYMLDAIVRSANSRYREGNPIISDRTYDRVLLPALKLQNPNSNFLSEIEPEPEEVFGKLVELPEPMLSTKKAYSKEDLIKWINSVKLAALEIGVEPDTLLYRITPKYDGFAAYSHNDKMYTRGNGLQGSDISRVIDRGLFFYKNNNQKLGCGEIVVDKTYFNNYLSTVFENSRNVISAVIKEGELDPIIKKGIEEKAVIFMPFSQSPSWHKTEIELIEEIERFWTINNSNCPYDTDGLVIEIIDEKLKNKLASTKHHHRWQIAYKKNTEFYNVVVQTIIWQTGRTGIITPIASIKPTRISGVIVSRVTCHHAANVLNNRIYDEAIVSVCRSGLVIPKIEQVVKASPLAFSVPNECPTCKGQTELRGDFLYCTNKESCSAQTTRSIEHFFKTIGNCDGFGIKVIEKLHQYNINTVSKVYQLTLVDLSAIIGGKTAVNLFNSLEKSKKIEIEDWRFLAAFGIAGLGRGDSENLLRQYTLKEILTLTETDIALVKGFGPESAKKIINSLKDNRDEINTLYPLFNLKETIKKDSSIVENKHSPNITIVFTGSMNSGSRHEIEHDARMLGFQVGSSVNQKTNYLVIGDKPGSSKVKAAKKYNVKTLSELEYFNLLKELNKPV